MLIDKKFFGDLLGMIEGGQTCSYHFDALGNTLAMSDAGQNLVNAYAYSPYGRIVNQQETITQPFTYVGQAGVMTEADTFYYMRARYYDAEVGRFISEDPIGFEGGLNLYAYVGGNPILAIDPSGLEAMLANSQLRGGFNPNDVRGGFNGRGESLVYHPDNYDPSVASMVLIVGASSAAVTVAAPEVYVALGPGSRLIGHPAYGGRTISSLRSGRVRFGWSRDGGPTLRMGINNTHYDFLKLKPPTQ